jgi:hypothetical protein
MKLLANRVEIMSQLEMKFLHVWDENLVKNPTTAGLASIEEIREEMDFFGRILHCYDCTFSLLQRTQTLFYQRKEGVARHNQNLNFPVANAAHVGEKRQHQ